MRWSKWRPYSFCSTQLSATSCRKCGCRLHCMLRASGWAACTATLVLTALRFCRYLQGARSAGSFDGAVASGLLCGGVVFSLGLYFFLLRRISARLVLEAARTEHLLAMLPEQLAQLPDLAPLFCHSRDLGAQSV